MLFRAYAYLTHCSFEEGEVVVFFDAASERDAWPTLQSLLAHTWRINADQIDAYNFFPEHELLGNHAYGDASTGDARLFESGGGPGGTSYIDPQRTLLLVRPHRLRRLLAGQQAAERLAQQCAFKAVA